MQAGRRQAEDDVSGFDVFAGDDAVTLDYADDESGEIIFAMGIEAGHLRGFSADQGAAVVLAGVGQTFHNFFGNFGLKFAGGEVIHEEERRSALDRNVIHAMVYQVGADGVVDLHFEGKFQLCPYAVHARNQDGIGILQAVNREQPSKSADFAQNALGEGLVGQIFDALLGAVGLVDIDACVRVSNGFGRILRHGTSVYDEREPDTRVASVLSVSSVVMSFETQTTQRTRRKETL